MHVTVFLEPGSLGTCGSGQTLFFWAPKSLQMVNEAMKLKDTYPSPRRRLKGSPLFRPEGRDGP